MKNHLSFIILLVLLAGCSAYSSLTNSFSKRKYTPGNFVNLPAPKPVVATNALPESKPGNVIAAKQNPELNIALNTPGHTSAYEQVTYHKSIKNPTNILKRSVANTPKYQWQKAWANNLMPPDTTLAKRSYGQVYGPDNEMRTSKILTVMSSIFLLAAIIIPSITSLVFLPTWFFIIISLAFIVMAIMTCIHATEQNKKPSVSDNDSNSSAVGLIGFIIEMFGLGLVFLSIPGLLGGLLLGGLITASVSSAFPILAALFIIVGLALCLASLSGKNKYYGFALAGTIISMVIVGIIIANYVMNNIH